MSSGKQTDTSLRADTSASEPNNPSHDVEYPVAFVCAGKEWGVWSKRTKLYARLSKSTASAPSSRPYALQLLERKLPKSPEASALRDRILSAFCVAESWVREDLWDEHMDLVQGVYEAAITEPSFKEFHGTPSCRKKVRPAPVRWLSTTAKHPHPTSGTCLVNMTDLLERNPMQEVTNTVDTSAGATAETA